MDELEKLLRAFVVAGSGLKDTNVIDANDDAPTPRDAFATLLLIDDPALAYPVNHHDNDRIISSSYRQAQYSLQFFRKGAVANALAFCIYSNSFDGLIDQNDGEFYFANAPLSYEKLDVIVGDSYEERALVTMEVKHTVTTTQDTVTIDSVSGTIDYGGIITAI